jgi:hypothetical protein
MILSQRGSCSPISLGRRQVEVGVRVRVIGIGVLLLLLLLIPVLLLQVLLLAAPRRTIIRRPLVIRGDVLLGGLVGWQVILAGQLTA